MVESTAQKKERANDLTGIPIDRFARGRAALVMAFAWGLAEATFFFFVPDVLLTLIACRALRPALKAALAALGGALLGGAAMYAFGLCAPGAARAALDYVPAISPKMIARVTGQVDEGGFIAVLLGPLKGIPYKIYAVEWGAQGRSLIGFLLISIPARYIRFFLAPVVARLLIRALEPLTLARARVEILIIASIWIVIYGFYFWRVGW